jgi:hypothetical protein
MTSGKNFIPKMLFFSDASQTLTAKGKVAIIQSFIPFLRAVEAVKIKQ